MQLMNQEGLATYCWRDALCPLTLKQCSRIAAYFSVINYLKQQTRGKSKISSFLGRQTACTPYMGRILALVCPLIKTRFKLRNNYWFSLWGQFSCVPGLECRNFFALCYQSCLCVQVKWEFRAAVKAMAAFNPWDYCLIAHRLNFIHGFLSVAKQGTCSEVHRTEAQAGATRLCCRGEITN